MNSKHSVHRRAFLRAMPVLAYTGAVALAQDTASPAALQFDLKIPKQRPYLALTPGEIARAKDRAKRFGWAKIVIDHTLAEANTSLAAAWSELPPKGTFPGHTRLGSRLFGAALAFNLTRNRKYAEWTRDGLLAYAAIYPGLPLMSLRYKIQDSSLNEAVLIVLLAQAYDMVADSGVFTDEQKKRVEQDLLRASITCFRITDFHNDPRVKDLHYRCYNYQVWHLAAVGLVGLTLRDRKLVDYAINSPYGLRHLIAHDINDDGIFWERSLHYHEWTMDGIIPLAEALVRCGVDLYASEVPPDLSSIDQHYLTDTSTRPKSLRLLWEAPLYACFPDL